MCGAGGSSGSNDIKTVAWYDVNSGGVTHAVGTKVENELGLFDLTGNVWEWCFDVNSGSLRRSRSGSWENYFGDFGLTARTASNPGLQKGVFGFRVGRRSAP
jgi:formylglycine-generating enzyme required for sulfatase activity